MASPKVAPMVNFVSARVTYAKCKAACPGGISAQVVAGITEGILKQMNAATRIHLDDAIKIQSLLGDGDLPADAVATISEAMDHEVNLTSKHEEGEADKQKQKGTHLETYGTATLWNRLELAGTDESKLQTMAIFLCSLSMDNASEPLFALAARLAVWTRCPIESAAAVINVRRLKQYVKALTNMHPRADGASTVYPEPPEEFRQVCPNLYLTAYHGEPPVPCPLSAATLAL